MKADPKWVNFTERFQPVFPNDFALSHLPGLVWMWTTKRQHLKQRTVPYVCMPLCAPLSHLPLSVFALPRYIFPRLRRPWTLWLLCLCFRQRLGALRELFELCYTGKARGRAAVDGTQPGGSSRLLWGRHQDSQLEIISSPGHDRTAPRPSNLPGTAGTLPGACRDQSWHCCWGWGLLYAGAADKRAV